MESNARSYSETGGFSVCLGDIFAWPFVCCLYPLLSSNVV